MTLPFATSKKANLIKKLILRRFAHFSILNSIKDFTSYYHQKRLPIFKCVNLRRYSSLKNHHRLRRVAVFSSMLHGTLLSSKRCFEMCLTVKSYDFGLWFRAASTKFYGGMLVIFSLLSSSFSRAPPQPKLLLLLRVVCGYLPCVEDQKVCEPLLLVKIRRKWQNMR